MNGKRGETDAPMGAALLAGSASAVVAALASLPLQSPHDGLLNSASVTWGVLALAAVAGLLWWMLRTKPQGRRLLAVAMTSGFIGWTMAALIAGSAVERMASFTVPLAAIAFGGLAVLTPTLTRVRAASRKLAVAGALAVAVVVGIALAGYGDQESGRLELPPRAEVVAVS